MKRRRHDRHQEPKLSQEDWDAILDSAIAASAKRGAPQKKTLNPILKDYLAKHRVLIQYIHDLYGHRKGVLAATAKDRIGWSSVSNYDVVLRRIDPLKLPVIQRLISTGAPLEKIMANKAYMKAIRKNCSIAVPIFDPDIGIFLAVGRAEQGIAQAPPRNKQLTAAIEKMKGRALRYFK